MSRDAIEDLVHRYADAVVRHDGEQWAATWAEDARWVLSADRDVTGRDAISAVWYKAMDGFEAAIQNVLNGSVTIGADGTTAEGRWYIIEHLRRRDGKAHMLLAYYDDTYVNVDGEWLFASRQLFPQYAGPPDLSAPFLNAFEPSGS